VTQRLRILLDTNVLIPLHDTHQVLEQNLANFVRLASVGGHQLLHHPATIADFERDPDTSRKARNLERIRQFPALQNPAPYPRNTPNTNANDSCDNEILYALECDAVHALVTEDKGIRAKARRQGLIHRVYSIQTAEDWLRRLHETHQVVLPNIQDVPLHSLTPELANEFFDSLRLGYISFDDWFRTKARENRMAWVYRSDNGALAAICIYATQTDEAINSTGQRLPGKALKLCTFKVGETVRGRKIGELFLKAAFRYATANACENLFIHAGVAHQDFLLPLLEDFGFEPLGDYDGDVVLVKAHPLIAPTSTATPPLEYARKYFPHFRTDEAVQKFLIPIKPEFHNILFPDYSTAQGQLFDSVSSVGNAIKLAYLCRAQTNAIKAGDIVLFYRTRDEQAVTSIGVVEQFDVLSDAAKIASLVSRRTVFSIKEIDEMAKRPTKVILFRLAQHFVNSPTYNALETARIVNGPIQSICKISDASFSKLLAIAGR
jgi:GNAT superfamily N-acetyltransferase